ncbi:uncharacterized protein N7483_001195 [Penicillium malachiteum]|uniref:uncharacterized protein n=1 Tax=Penicillium malachiteum TaxID=1324776 RepID=UPI002549B7C9|nr:uncharacterized protein N7483_001195 [Penicillium malachiteum]KAJ5736070.1 hypothetical protein N7483_001195 [Penicillium malachiteum]
MPSKRQPSSADPKKKANVESVETSRGRKRKAEKKDTSTIDSFKKSHKRQKDHQFKNNVPTKVLDVYVFGTNCYGELGLGDLTKKSEILRPVLNQKLAAHTVGVVHVAVGGVHSVALTHDNQILTWGVNDEGTLARDTKADKDTDNAQNANGDAGSSEDSDDDDVLINLKEATPMPVDSSYFPQGTVFAQLAASDSATFALTVDGLVYGWGNFRGSSGSVGFSLESKKEQRIPTLILGLENVTKIVAGAQHILALTSKGTVFSWGCDEQHQLGRRRASPRQRPPHPRTPYQCALPPGICDIGVGLYHSFAVHTHGVVYGWGSNNFGQTGISTTAGQNDAMIPFPSEIRAFRNHGALVSIFGGKDHSIAVTESGKCLAWGRIDNKALGLGLKDMAPSDVIHDEYDRPRILTQPTLLRGIDGRVVFAASGTDHSFAVTDSGKGYSWGFNAQSQAGQVGLDEVETPTLLQSKSLEGKKLASAAAGGQFSMVVGLANW